MDTLKTSTGDSWWGPNSVVPVLPVSISSSIAAEGTLGVIHRLWEMGAPDLLYCSRVVNEEFLHETAYQETMSAFRRLTEAVSPGKNGRTKQLLLAGLYMVNKGLSHACKADRLLGAPGKHILLDLPDDSEPQILENILFDLQVNGYAPVLLSPYRYAYFQKTPKRFKRLRHLGCRFQLDLLALTAARPIRERNMVMKLLNENFFDMVGLHIDDQHDLEVFEDFARNGKADELFRKYPLDNFRFVS